MGWGMAREEKSKAILELQNNECDLKYICCFAVGPSQ